MSGQVYVRRRFGMSNLGRAGSVCVQQVDAFLCDFVARPREARQPRGNSIAAAREFGSTTEQQVQVWPRPGNLHAHFGSASLATCNEDFGPASGRKKKPTCSNGHRLGWPLVSVVRSARLCQLDPAQVSVQYVCRRRRHPVADLTGRLHAAVKKLTTILLGARCFGHHLARQMASPSAPALRWPTRTRTGAERTEEKKS